MKLYFIDSIHFINSCLLHVQAKDLNFFFSPGAKDAVEPELDSARPTPSSPQWDCGVLASVGCLALLTKTCAMPPDLPALTLAGILLVTLRL